MIAYPVRASSEAVTFIFISDVHACRMGDGLSPNCQQEGKTDGNLLRHVRAINELAGKEWPKLLQNGEPSMLPIAGALIGAPAGIVVGGDMTDDGGGQTAETREGSQILQFGHRYHQGPGDDAVHYPVYEGLGNHDLDQDGKAPDIDWYRDELRDYVRLNHEPSAFFKPAVPVLDFDEASSCYSWNWGDLHLVQLHRFGGDTRKGAANALPWLRRDLAANAGQGRPVVIFQHYGWDPFSTERWDLAKKTFDVAGAGDFHWWSLDESNALLDVLSGHNVIGLFHGHQHETPMVYSHGGLDVFKPVAAFMGGFGLARFTSDTFEVALGQVVDDSGSVAFSNAFFKPLNG